MTFFANDDTVSRCLDALLWQMKEKRMDRMDLLIFLVTGAIAGWLAGTIMKGRGFGLLGNIIVGVIGAFIGGLLFNLVGISVGGMIGSLVMAVAGAVVLLWVVGLIKKEG